MSDVNVVIVSGRVTQDPEARKTPSGTAVCDIGIASNRYSSDKRQFTTFVKVTLWKKQAEWAIEALNVGDGVLVRGALVDDNYEDKKTGIMTKGRTKIDNAQLQLLYKKQSKSEKVEDTDEPVSTPEIPEV